MPIYEYQCEKCNNRFEVIEPIDSKEIVKKCEKCGGKSDRLISTSSFHLKGGGWYDSGYSGKSDAKPQGCPAATDSPACSSCCAPKK